MDHVKRFPYCPKCTGLLLDDDAFLDHLGVWIRYMKCSNCAWRIELGTYTRFAEIERVDQDFRETLHERIGYQSLCGKQRRPGGVAFRYPGASAQQGVRHNRFGP